jgi:subtilisin-like proprotein convertase family protein
MTQELANGDASLLPMNNRCQQRRKGRSRGRVGWIAGALIAVMALFSLATSAQAVTYSNTNSITINDNASATPYPSIITVPSVSGTVTKVTVTVNGLTHTYPDDVRILLVGPQGQNVMLMYNQGAGADVSGVNLTFDDSAASELPDSQITSGTYKPCSDTPQDNMNSPAPAGPYGTTLSAFNGVDPQGDWSLYVLDYVGNDFGSISGGWELTLTGVTANSQIGASLVTSINNDANLSSYSFPSATYSNNTLYICFTTSSCATSEGCPTGTVPIVTGVSGAGLTFTEIGTAGGLAFSGTNRRIQAWRALVTSGATTGVVTVTLSGQSYSMGAAMIAFTGTKTSGTNGADAVVQSATNSNLGGTSLTVTLNAFADSHNRPVAFFAHRYNEATTNEAGYTELWDATNANTPVMGYEAEWHATAAETTPSVSGWTSGYDNGGFALEIAAETAITIDAVSEGNTGSTAVGSLAVPHTVGASGTNRILVVGVNIFSGSTPFPTVSTMTYAGQSMSFLTGVTDAGARIRSEMWYIKAPTTGTNDIVITFSANAVAVAGGMSYTGVDQTTPVGTAATAQGSGTAPSVVVSSAPGELVLDTVGIRQNTGGTQTLTAGSGQQERYNDVSGTSSNSNVVGAGSEEVGAASVTMSWTAFSSGAWAIVAVGIKPAGSSTSSIPLYRSVGVTATALASGTSNGLTISGSTATFDSGLPDNIGVGDVIQYDSDNNGSIDALAFIHGRTSSTVYTVKGKNGGAPIATQEKDNDWAIYRAYTSLANWQSQTENPNISEPTENDVNPDKDLVAANTVMMVACYGDGQDSTELTIDGWTTGANNYVKIYTPFSTSEVGASQRHSGTWSTNAYRLVVSNAGAIVVSDNYVNFDGLQVYVSSVDYLDEEAIYYYDMTGTAVGTVSNCIIRGVSTSNNYHCGIASYNVGTLTLYVYNNIIYDFQGNSTNQGVVNDDAESTFYLYNNTIHNCYSGIYVSQGSIVAKNNLIKGSGNTYTYYGTFAAGTDYNSTDSTDTPGQGSHNRTSQTFSFVDESGDNFHLTSGDTGARNWGTDLSSDSNLPFANDIDGEIRSGTWDIGADEALPKLIYRSVGTNTGNLNIDSRTVTISGNTATFSGSMPDNIGVGDVLQYQVSSTYYLAFIHGRASDTVYTVKSANGGTPQAAVAGTSVNVYRAYTSLANWQALDENDTINDTVENFDTSRNLVSANTVMNVACYGDGVDTASVTISGWTTGTDNYIKIYTPVSSSEVGVSQRHNGKWDDSKYRIEAAGSAINIGGGGAGAGNVWIDGLQIYLSSVTGHGNSGILSNQTNAANHRISNNIVRSVTNNTYNYIGIYMYAAAAGSTARIWNNIIYDFAGATGWGIAFSSSNFTDYVYNNTVYNCASGYYRDGGTVIYKNNISYSNGDNYYGTFDATSTNNLSGPSQTDAPGSNARQGVTVTFVDPTGSPPDFHLASTDAGAKDYGADLSSDANLSFSGDIDGETRPFGSAWDIGADEYVTPPTPTPLYRSVGTNGSNLNTAGRTMAISGTTVTFSDAMPNNVGVGDVLTYSSGGNRLAFIHGRSSSTVFTVMDKGGNAPTAAPAGTAVGVYRAYTSLANWQSQTENPNISEPTENDVNPNKDLVAANTVMIVACYGDGPDSTGFTISGWSTSPNSYIKIYTPTSTNQVGVTQRHNGTAGTGYRINPGITSIRVDSPYVQIEGLEIYGFGGVGNGTRGIHLPSLSTRGVTISQNLIHSEVSGNNGWGIHVDNYNQQGYHKIFNNIIYEINEGMRLDTNYPVYVYNNTVVNCSTGIYSPYNKVVAKNNIAYNNTDNYNGTFDGSGTNNLSGPSQTDAPGSNARQGVAVTFVNASGSPPDFHLASADAGAKDYGADLSSDTNLAFSDDIDGETRPFGSAWDIGADEYITAAPNLTQIHYRWRNDNGGESGGLNLGTGADGSVTLSTSANINTDVLGSLRSTYPDGISTTVTSNPTGTSISVTSTTGFAANDEIILINLRGTSGDTADVGNYEFLEIDSVSNGTTLNLKSSIQKSYGGTSFSNQSVIVQRVPQWTNVFINNGGTLTANDWDGTDGGLVVFRATGTVTVDSGGSINVNALGYRLGSGVPGDDNYGFQAESYTGTGSATPTNNAGGGGGGDLTNVGGDVCGQGGGGGGYGSAGTDGGYGSYCIGSLPQNNAGATYGVADLSKIYLGSGGGGGASDENSSVNSGDGARGAGAVMIFADSITVNGNLTANGADAPTSPSEGDNGMGGGGSGGSIYLAASSANLGTNLVTATGGAGGPNTVDPTWIGEGGDGGDGRIRVEADTINGTTSPAASTAGTPAGGSGATFMANEDTAISGLAKSTKARLRLEVSNEGSASSGGVAYQLQVAQTSTCSSGTYSAVPTDTSGHWQIVGSSYITDGEATSNITSGLTDEATTFVPGELKDAGNTTGSITLNSDAFTEIEFAVQATTNAMEGAHYCFRLYNTTGGAPLNTYTQYGEVTLAGPTLTLANHASGQAGDKFTVTSPVTDVLYRFKLTRSGTVTIDNLRVNFTTTAGVANGDVTNGELWEDVNNNGVIDSPGDTLIQGSVTPSAGVLTFTTNFTPGTSGTNCLVRATVSNLVAGDTTTFSLGAVDIDEVEGGVTESGSISNATHTADSGLSWWDPGYAYREQITITAPATKTIANGYPIKITLDHASLVGAGKSQADGDDIRIVYWNGGSWIEVARTLFNNNLTSSSWNLSNTTILFKAQAAIPAGTSDSNYYIYYGNPSASGPPINTLSSRYFVAQSLGETQTSSTSYTTKVSLSFTPTATSEQWVVVGSWRQQHYGTDSNADAGESQITVNGVVRTGTDRVGYREEGNHWKTFSSVLRITGTTSTQTVTIDFRASGGTDGIDNARLIAFMIPNPSNADVQYGESLATTTDTANPTNALSRTFSPASAGDYIWMASGSNHEGPGGSSNGGLYAQDETGADQQNSDESYIPQANSFVPFSHVEQRTLTTGSKTFTIRHQPDTAGSERQGLTMLLFRSDVFDLVETTNSTTNDSTTSTSYVDKSPALTLNTASVASNRDYVYLVIMGMYEEVMDPLTSIAGQVRLDGVQQTEEVSMINRGGYDRQVTWTYAETSTGGRTLNARYRSSTGQTAHARWGHIVSLRYIEPNTSLGSEEYPLPASLTQIHYRWRNDDGGEQASGGAVTVNAGQTTSTTTSSVTNHVIDTPAHSTGDVIYLFAAIDGSCTMTPPSGFTAVPNMSSASVVSAATTSLWRKTATASEPSTYTWTSSVAERSVQIAWSQSGDGGVDVSATANTGTGTTATCPAVTTTVANTLILRLVATDEISNPISTGSGYTKIAELSYTSAATASVQYRTQAAIGSTGTLALTLSVSEQWAAFTVAIKPVVLPAATWAANEDTKLTDLAKSTTKRVRFEVSNEGGSLGSGAAYQLQVAQTFDCSSGTYSPVLTDTSGHWQIVGSSYITDGEATSNIASGLTDEATTFVAGQLKDAGNTTGGITLNSDAFTEIEFAVQATTNAYDGANYCFRLYNTTAGAPLNTYSTYAEVTLWGTAVTLSEASTGQITDQFDSSASLDDALLYRLRLYNNSAAAATVDRVVLHLTGVSGIVAGDLSDLRIRVGSGPTGTTVSSAPTVNITGDTGTITFDGDFSIAGNFGTNYFVSGDLANLAYPDTLTISLAPSDITLVSGSVIGTAPSDVTHTTDLIHYEYRRLITINVSQRGSSCTGPLSNFPVLLSLSGDWLKTKANGGKIYSSDGNDIIFKDANLNQIDHEIEKYDGSATGGTLLVWVRIPTLFENNQDTVIYMEYGCSLITSPTENPTGVWDSNYVGVWHLDESGAGVEGEYKDSTQYTNHGTGGSYFGSTTPTQVGGKIDRGQEFNGDYDVIAILGSEVLGHELDITGNQVTVEAWALLHSNRPYPPYSDAPAGIVGKSDGYTDQYFLWQDYQADRTLQFIVDTGLTAPTVATDSLTTYDWYHIVAVKDATKARIYCNGSEVRNVDASGSLQHADAGVSIGAYLYTFDGPIDEVRISDTARDACWIGTSYNNENAPGSFATVGEEIVLGTFENRKQITLNVSQRGSSCTGPLSNFPVLIDLSGDWLKTKANGGSIYNSNGYDIIFRDVNDNQLDHEIEKYDGVGTGTPTSGISFVRSGGVDGGGVAVDAVHNSAAPIGATQLIISHTTSGSNRLMLVGVSINNDNFETVSTLTYNGVALTFEGAINNSRSGGDDARVEIWSLKNPPTGTYNVVITFSAALSLPAVAGVMTFTGVNQSTPLGTFASAENDGTAAAVTVSSGTGETVFGVVCTEYGTITDGQTNQWNVSAGSSTYGAGSTAAGASSVNLTWTLSDAGSHWAAAGISIKPANTSSPSFSFDIGSAGTNRLVVVTAGDESSGTNLTGVTVDGKTCTLIATANNNLNGSNHQEMWYCNENNLGSSSGTVTVATSGGDSSWGAHAHLYMGVAQSGPTDYGVDQTSINVTTVTVSGIDVPANGLVVMGAGEGTDGLTISSWTSPLVQRQSQPGHPDSADLMTASGIETSPQTNKTYTATFSGTFNRGTGIVASFAEAPGVSGTGKLVAWVRIPTLFENNQDTVIYMYYGNPYITSATANATGVWNTSNGWRGVWHLNETVADEGTSGIHIDSTSNNNSGTQHGNSNITGKMANGQDFDGNTTAPDYVNVPHHSSIDFGAGQDFTVSAWVKTTQPGVAGVYPLIVSKEYDALLPRYGFSLVLHDGNTDSRWYLDTYSNNTKYLAYGSNNIADGNWHYLVGIRSGSDLITYENGNYSNTTAASSGSYSKNVPFRMGTSGEATPGSWSIFDGSIDEVRISGVARDACWIETEYNNYNSPSTFADTGAGEEFGYKYRKQIKILDSMTPAGCTSDLSNFPVLIDLSGDWLKTEANGGNISHPYGYDIIFKAEDGETKLDHEIEKYDGVNGTLVAWVRIPTLKVNADTVIYMYYGNPSITSPTANPTGVWDSNYAAVWHLKEGTGGTGAIKNSTSYSNDGTNSTGLSLGATGKADGAIYFDGTGDYVTIPTPTNTDPANRLTVSAWVKAENSGHHGEVVSRGDDYTVRVWNTGQVLFSKYNGSTWINMAPSGVNVFDGQLHQIVAGQNATGMFLYVDGVLKENNGNTDPIVYAHGNTVEIGRHGNGDTGYDFLGIIDEVRISTVARDDACWIATEYNNQNSPSTSVSVEGEETLTFNHRKQITILDSMTPASCSGNLSNFPVHISLSGNWLKTVANGGDIYSADGYDIIFRAQDGVTKLDHEIEKYDGVNGTLVAWIRIPTLSNNSNTIVYMYYGNSTITTSQANPTGVWNTSYGWRAVWHLKEDPSGAAPQIKDSTSNANHGTVGGSWPSEDQVAGKIDGSLDFDAGDYVSMGDPDSLDMGTSDFSIEAWVRLDPSANPDGETIIWKGAGSPSNAGYWLFWYNLTYNFLRFTISNGDGVTTRPSVESTISIKDGLWHHVVAVADRDGYGRLYIDGQLNNSADWSSYGGSISTTTDFALNVSTPEWTMTGGLDEVRIAAVARDACWVGTSYTNESSPLASYTVEGEEFDYKYRKQITVKDSMTPTSCSSDLSNYPVLISLADQAWLKTKAADPVNGCVENTNGYDIIFKAEDGETKLDHEIEKYDGVAGTLVAWVRIPILKYNTDTIIYMYYGNPAITSPTANPKAVWDTHYKGVWHLGETSGAISFDSTSNGKDGAKVSVLDPTPTSAKIGGGQNWDAIDDKVTITNLTAEPTQATYSAWIKPNSGGELPGCGAGGCGRIFDKRTSGAEVLNWYVEGDTYNRMTLNQQFSTNQGSWHTASGSIIPGNQYYVVVTYDSSSDTNDPVMYINGQSVAATEGTMPSGSPNSNTDPYVIGNRGNQDRTFDGWIDEFRISNTIRDACWIGTEYNNQDSPLAHITVEGVENMDYLYQQQITISKDMISANCSSNLTNFPVLISLSGDWLKTVGNGGNISHPLGYDIIFRDSNGLAKLDHEIEDYNGTAGTLLAWVRIPTLYFNDNTTIYVYYGNPAITSPTENSAGVWNSGFKGVWHLKESGNGSLNEYKDSTQYLNHGQGGDDYGSLYVPTRVAGKVGYGQDFNNSDGKYDLIDVGNNPVLEIPGNQITLEAWVQHNVSVERQYGILDRKGWNNGYSIWMQGDHWMCPSSEMGCVQFNLPGSTHQLNTVTTLTPSTWHHVVGTYDGASMKVFIDGVQDSVTLAKTDNITAPLPPEDQTWIGHGDQPVDQAWSAEWEGQIDEVRISSVGRDACWIQTEYNNMNNPATYITLEPETGFAPTYVKVTSFKATGYPEGTLLEWKTGYEVDNLGFHIYREENGQLVRLTPEPIAGSALLAGSGIALRAGRHYTWWDVSLSPQSSSLSPVRYWLKDIDLSGKETMHGPVTAVLSQEPSPEKMNPELLSELGMRREQRYQHYWKVRELKEKLTQEPKAEVEVKGKIAKPLLKARRSSALSPRSSSLDTAMQPCVAGRRAVKILVTEEGWYHVSQYELVATGLSPNVNPRNLQLFVEEKEQAIRVTGEKDGKFDPADAVEFYGVGIDTPSTDTNVYWLVEGTTPGKRLKEWRSQGDQIGPPSFLHTEERKDRVIYFPNLRNGDEENWFGPVISPSGADQILMVRHLDLAHSGNARLEVSIQGATEGPHQVKVLINEVEVDEAIFVGQSKGFVQVEVPQALLREGENLVSFVAMGGQTDYSMLDLISLSYWHTYTADGDELKFRAQGGENLVLSGFSNSVVQIFDITDPGDLVEVLGRVVPEDGGYRVEFRVPGTGERALLAVSVDKVKTPGGLVLNKPSSWSQNFSGYDLVMISHRDFIEGIKSLKRFRESQGLSVALVDLEDVYDEFSFGVKSPKAIKDFLSFGKTKWKKSPRFVLLVGDASFDPKNYYGYGYWDFVPTKLIDTQYLETASDDWFVDFNGDGLPEMAIGRLPVRTLEEANIVVSKILTYERTRPYRVAVLVADKVEWDDDFDFEKASEEVRNVLPSSLMVSKIYRSQFSSDSQAKGVFLASINGGSLLVNFIGHGSLDMWRGILTSEDLLGLTNRGLPFFINMTCLNGFFQDPYMDSLAETLVKTGGGGAIGVWTSSGVTEPANQAPMNKELMRRLFNGKSLTLGEATSQAKAATYDQDVRKTWILFGDPSMKLK